MVMLVWSWRIIGDKERERERERERESSRTRRRLPVETEFIQISRANIVLKLPCYLNLNNFLKNGLRH